VQVVHGYYATKRAIRKKEKTRGRKEAQKQSAKTLKELRFGCSDKQSRIRLYYVINTNYYDNFCAGCTNKRCKRIDFLGIEE
jgi:hypothetical protein